ncbi:cation:proton antiporter [uncultured Sulfitobacter sp.]|uniref:cation:proton antiporter n=1 Tax=uncultured Sulfitobacter sp. TaxID=191468 RepID=UPI0026302B98|nr:cation:proton antiporter [uncultured Sulfitobacter sp.]
MIDPYALLTLGVLFCVGLAADQLGRRTHIPRVTLLLLCGLVAGNLGLVPERTTELTDTVTITALTLVAILLGGSLKLETLKARGVEILVISLAVVLTTLIVVTVGLVLMGMDAALALVLASIATATAPAATLDVIKQSGITNRFTEIVKGIVAIDDAWGLLVFSLCLAIASQFLGQADDVGVPVLLEIGGAIVLGLVIGLPAAFLTGRIEQGEPLQVEALAIGFLTAGLAVWLGVSFLMAGMVVGALIVNLARHHTRAFHEIEHVQWPFMIVFFILAGAALELETLNQLGLMGVAFIALRAISRLLGGWLGAAISAVPHQERHLYGAALMPQAGVAIGMALLAGQALPLWEDQIIGLTIGATVFFELAGPFATLWAVRRSL